MSRPWRCREARTSDRNAEVPVTKSGSGRPGSPDVAVSVDHGRRYTVRFRRRRAPRVPHGARQT